MRRFGKCVFLLRLISIVFSLIKQIFDQGYGDITQIDIPKHNILVAGTFDFGWTKKGISDTRQEFLNKTRHLLLRT